MLTTFIINQHNRLFVSKQLVITLIISWLFITNMTLAHAQSHSIISSAQCELCHSSFDHSPFTLQKPVTFPVIVQNGHIVATSAFTLTAQKPLFLCNKDPPVR